MIKVNLELCRGTYDHPDDYSILCADTLKGYFDLGKPLPNKVQLRIYMNPPKHYDSMPFKVIRDDRRALWIHIYPYPSQPNRTKAHLIYRTAYDWFHDNGLQDHQLYHAVIIAA